MTLGVPSMDVSRETLEALQVYAELTQKWTARINLISKSTVGDIWERHIQDSLQLYPLAPPFGRWVDLGSGGGFPALVIAVVARERAPDAEFVLIESDARKCAFLRTVIRELDLSATVYASRIEETPPQQADIVSARALASLPELFALTVRHLKPTGTAFFLKGRQAQAELDAVSADWTYEFAEHPSITDPHSRILQFKGISRAA
ncbi:MAG: 16S rRNA (guanine(527)-N(7))-methyltransferase RsmG [Pseudomonadota bacterium]